MINWDVAAGKWVILRMGYSLTGEKNHPASPEATGYEVDKDTPRWQCSRRSDRIEWPEGKVRMAVLLLELLLRLQREPRRVQVLVSNFVRDIEYAGG
jgi:hypothetical protein